MSYSLLLSFDKNKEYAKAYDDLAYTVGQAAAYTHKEAAVKSNALSGELYAASDKSIMLSVPNALVRGAFDAIDANGLSLPGKNGKFNAHIVVMTPDEVSKLGGVEKITERGHRFHYNLSSLHEAPITNSFDYSKTWFLSVTSPELAQLRKTYGLDSTPGKHGFHVVVALRKLGVLGHNEISKLAAIQKTIKLVIPRKSKLKEHTDMAAKASKLLSIVTKPQEQTGSVGKEGLEVETEADTPLGSNTNSMLG
jgi:hypothetical protein